MNENEIQRTIEELSLALLYLTRFTDHYGKKYNEISWKGYDFDALKALDKSGFIIETKLSRGYGKYVYMTEKGREKAIRQYKVLVTGFLH